MKKILVAFDNGHFSEGAFEMARRLNETAPIHLVGFFLPSVHYANDPVGAESIPHPFFAPLMEEENVNFIEDSIFEFEEKCSKNNIRYDVHKNLIDAAIPSLRVETRFSDLLIIGSEMFYKNLGKEKLNPYLKYAIHGAECPVLIVPEKFEFPTSNILAYDGNETSVFAIKQFKLFFPELCKNKTTLLYASQKDEEIPYLSCIEEYAAISFPGFETCEVNFDAKKYFATWISEKNEAILITGSFGRSEFSEFFKQSFVTGVITEHYLPVFIAHK